MSIEEENNLPPLKECSGDDIFSFKPLAKALKSDPDNKSASTVVGKIDAKSLAKLVSNLRLFQRLYLGKDAPKDLHPYWPMVRIPDDLFRDRSTTGPLYQICSSAYQHLKETGRSLASIDFASFDQYGDNVSLMERIENDLFDTGLIQKPAIYWDKSVDVDIRPQLESILNRFGGVVVTDHRHATHVIGHDPEEGDSQEQLDEDKVHDMEGNINLEKKFLRTEGIDSKTKMALVHWWYWPLSYDEWMSSDEVEGTISEPPPRPPGGPWCVSCKFIRDVARFNEWGMEADYAIADYEDKVKLYQKATNKSTSKATKKKATSLKADKNSDDNLSIAGSGTDTPRSASPADISLMSGNIRSDRRGGAGMNPRYILTGHGKTRHLVHDGALRISPEADGILDYLVKQSSSYLPPDEQVEDAVVGGTAATGPKKKKKLFDLPAIGSILPPTQNKALGTITITELSAVPIPLPTQTAEGFQHQQIAPSISSVPKTRTVAVNRRFDLTKLLDNDTAVTAERIRGGGIEDDLYSSSAAPTPSSGPPRSANMPSNTPQITGIPPSAVTGTTPLPQANNAIQMGHSNLQPATKPIVAANQPPIQGSGVPAASSGAAIVAPPRSVSAAPTNVVSSSAPAQPTRVGTAPLPSSTGSNTKVVPTPTTSSSSAPAPKTNQVVPLTKRPLSQWEQDIPGPAQDDIPQEPPQFKTAKPSWYDSKAVSEFEEKMLPEWFDDSAPHRTSTTYKEARESIMRMSEKVGNRFITFTVVRRTIAGDAGSLLRLHNFLMAMGLINDDAMNDSKPTPAGLRSEAGATWRLPPAGEASYSNAINWTDQQRNNLIEAVVKHHSSNKRRKLNDDENLTDSPEDATVVPIDWNAVAQDMGNGVTSDDCEREFLSLPLDEKATSGSTSQIERSITPDNTGEKTLSATGGNSKATSSTLETSKRKNREEILRELVDGASLAVVKAATDAALKATGDLEEAQKASVLGIVASQAMSVARQEEENVRRVLDELLEQRMLKLENRVALLDDVEGMLEAERVALELERRDLYTSRCKHWFSGGS